MRQDGTFGGEAEIQALCWLYNVRAKVYMGGLSYAVTSREYGDPKDKQVRHDSDKKRNKCDESGMGTRTAHLPQG